MTPRTPLKKLCQQLRIPMQPADEVATSQRISDERLIGILGTLDSIINHDAILIGGTTTHPTLLGYRSMRSLGNNLDYVGGRQAIRELKTEFRHLSYDPRDFIFLHYDGVMVRMTLDHIYDWNVTSEFRAAARDVETERGKIHVAAPEYTIMLKLRKAVERYNEQQSRRGKDHLDIVNLFLAPQYRTELPHINYSLLAELCFKDVTPDLFKIGKLVLENLDAAKKHLKRDEWLKVHDLHRQQREKPASDIYTELQKAITVQYMPLHIENMTKQHLL
jgi:hypothetical protein